MRANYGYNGAEDDDSPIHGMALSFEPKDFLHIKEVKTSLSLCGSGQVPFYALLNFVQKISVGFNFDVKRLPEIFLANTFMAAKFFKTKDT